MTTETTTGSCLCGAIKYSFTGKPVTRVWHSPPPHLLQPLFLLMHMLTVIQAICHCLDCRKISGSHYSDNALLTSSQFTVLSGTPKTFTIAPKAEGPKANITSHFCGDCGSTLWRSGEAFEGYMSVRLGTLDDETWIAKGRPDGEYFGERRVAWLPELMQKTTE